MMATSALPFLLGIAVLVTGQRADLTGSEKVSCSSPFVEVGGRCVYVDVLNQGTWQESRDLCRSLEADLVKVDSGDFFAALVNHLHGSGLPEDRHYWTGATDSGHDGVWVWVVNGMTVQMGTPFWASVGCSSVTQRPILEEGRDCVYLDYSFNFYFNNWYCDKASAYPICEM